MPAWFEGRSSLRTWLYQIATNACLTALGHRARRVLPSGLGGPGDDPHAPIVPGVAWLQPIAARRTSPVTPSARQGTGRWSPFRRTGNPRRRPICGTTGASTRAFGVAVLTTMATQITRITLFASG